MAKRKRPLRRRPRDADPVDPADVSLFRDAMRQLDVVPDSDSSRFARVLPGDYDPGTDPPHSPSSREESPALDPEDVSLFEDAMRQLDVTPRPDRAPSASGSPPAPMPVPPTSPIPTRDVASKHSDATHAPSDRSAERQPTARQTSVDPADVSLFMRAMRKLDVVPDKEAVNRHAESNPRGVRRRRPPKPGARSIDDRLDLHRNRVEDALVQLKHFLLRARHRGHRRVIVITGKGHHSPGGIAVLRRAVEDWVVRDGRSLIEAYSDAPRDEGGRGAFLLYLRGPQTS